MKNNKRSRWLCLTLILFSIIMLWVGRSASISSIQVPAPTDNKTGSLNIDSANSTLDIIIGAVVLETILISNAIIRDENSG